MDIDTLDITDARSVNQTFETVQPEIVIHCAALTAVDYCAEHPDEALEVNAFGTQTVALACQKHDAALVYMSTNEVFDGKTQRPYLEYDRPNPINRLWLTANGSANRWCAISCANTISCAPRGCLPTAAKTLSTPSCRLAQESQPLRVVVNEIASPTYNNDLAAAIGQLDRDRMLTGFTI